MTSTASVTAEAVRPIIGPGMATTSQNAIEREVFGHRLEPMQAQYSLVMTHLDHLTLFVRDHRTAARWYVDNLGFDIEFETPDGKTTAVRDDRDFTIFLTVGAATDDEPRCILHFEVPNVDAEYDRLITNDVRSVHAPRENPWGYGPELRDPDGHAVRLWDHRSVK